MTEGRNVRIRSAEEAHRFVNGRQLDYVKVGVFDIDGILRGKYLSRDKFFSALEKGFGFCDVVLGWDSQRPALRQCELHRLAHRLSRMRRVRILPDTCRPMPFEDDMLFFLCEFAGEAEAICPRGRSAGSRSAPRTWASMPRRPSSTNSSCSTRRPNPYATRATAT